MELRDVLITLTWTSIFAMLMFVSVVLSDFFRRGLGAFDNHECARKFLHLASGLFLAALPSFTDNPFVAVVIAGCAGSILALVRYSQKLSEYFGFIFQRRRGSLWYVVAILASAPLLRDNGPIFSLVFLILAIPDVAAAYLGMTYGKRKLFRKSLVGCSSHAATSLMVSTGWFMVNFESISVREFAVLIILSLCVSLVEGYSTKGLDNVTVPIVVASTGILFFS